MPSLMTAQIPKTINAGIIDRINKHLADSSYIDETSFSFKSILADISKLMKVDPFEANVAKAAAYQLCGNLDKMNHYFNLASNFGDTRVVSMQKSIGLSNLGYFKEAQELYQQSSDPIYGEFAINLDLGYCTFSFETLTNWFEKAEKMDIDISNLDSVTCKRANAILSASNTKQSRIAELADTAGEILREHNLFTAGTTGIEVEDDEFSDPCIYITFKIKTSHKKADELYDEFVSRLLNRFDSIPDFVHFSIRAVA